MSAQIVSLASIRAARGLVPIEPADAFGPPPGKRTGDRVKLHDGRIGIVMSWRMSAGYAPVLYLNLNGISAAASADAVEMVCDA